MQLFNKKHDGISERSRLGILSGGILATFLAFTLACGDGGGGSSSHKAPVVKYDIQVVSESDLLGEKYDTHAQIWDTRGLYHEFNRFALDESFLLPLYSSDIDKMVVTIGDAYGRHHLFWFRDVERVERLGKNNAVVTFKDGTTFQGRWFSNEEPINFYEFVYIGYASGLDASDSLPKEFHINGINTLVLDTAGSDEQFQERHNNAFASWSHPKTVFLADGTMLDSDLAYIIDCCGHWYSNTWHERMETDCQLIEEGGGLRSVSLNNLEEIELTGKFDGAYPQCRQVILRYKDGTQETGSLYMTSESYGGFETVDSSYRNWDKFILHDQNGALVVPLDQVKRIIPHSPSAE